MSSGSPSRIPRPPGRPSPLPSPPSLEIATVLAEAGPFDNLKSLVPSLSFTGSSADDESDLEDVPPFPKDHQPPIFIIQGHRAQVPFAVRPGVIALGDIHPDEHTARIILSAPTIPRMNLVMKEQLFVNTWVDRLTPQRPPRHVPWIGDNSVPRHDWISEGSIFPAETIKLQNGKIRQARVDQQIQNRSSKEIFSHSTPCTPGIRSHREIAVISKECPGRQVGCNRWSVHVPMTAIKQNTVSSGPGPSTPVRGRMGTRTHFSASPVLESCSDKTIKQLPSTCRKSSRVLPQLGSINSLAIRRGKKVSGLQLKEVDDLEYPDIPTAFRGSPTVWSPKFDPGVSSPNGKLFTDHSSMLSSLRSQYAALTSGISTPVTHENKECKDASVDSDTDSVSLMPSSSHDDEWAFENDLDLDLRDAADNAPLTPTPPLTPNIVPDRPRKSLNVPPDRCSARDSLTRSPSPPCLLSVVPAVKVSPAPLTGPPCVPLPPPPVLITPSTPPRVRGILKKVKSVRFEDVRCSQDVGLFVMPVPESTAARRPSPLRNSFMSPIDSATSADAKEPVNTEPVTSPTTLLPKAIQEPVIKKSHMMKSKLVPKGTILSSHRMSEIPILKFVDNNVRQQVPPVPELNGPATSTPGRHNRVASAEKENGQTTYARARKRWSTMNENDLRMGVEGAAPKSRLTTPLRNIFKFK
ncbi:hypothetical protein DFJ58DRAFT_909726 [Suillus subalutaceus]|uniref:uncharacterized protein n=1 Tax=Suillus subalutaceus TaxID=48586 RepID=UPI001B870D80|nr:uncharacterized protein DFJ58DRAFT_909726 [Suillus subalutaceus]KAG1876430.1 hypothetical protein DFJ58DRAFT_909726 [Suillus subalutaceus]